MSDHSEQYLVERLRNSEAFIPELSIVAEINQNIAGHISLTRIKVINNKTKNLIPGISSGLGTSGISG